MPNLEEFLSGKKTEEKIVSGEPATGSFSCQHEDCDEVIYDGVVDRDHRRLTWVCSNGHHSSVVI